MIPLPSTADEIPVLDFGESRACPASSSGCAWTSGRGLPQCPVSRIRTLAFVANLQGRPLVPVLHRGHVQSIVSRSRSERRNWDNEKESTVSDSRCSCRMHPPDVLPSSSCAPSRTSAPSSAVTARIRRQLTQRRRNKAQTRGHRRPRHRCHEPHAGHYPGARRQRRRSARGSVADDTRLPATLAAARGERADASSAINHTRSDPSPRNAPVRIAPWSRDSDADARPGVEAAVLDHGPMFSRPRQRASPGPAQAEQRLGEGRDRNRNWFRQPEPAPPVSLAPHTCREGRPATGRLRASGEARITRSINFR